MERAAQMTDPLLHTHQAQAAHTTGIESPAVVFHGKNDFGTFLTHNHTHGTCLGVAGAIM